MVRGLIAGLGTGGIVSVLGLGALSLLVPPPAGRDLSVAHAGAPSPRVPAVSVGPVRTPAPGDPIMLLPDGSLALKRPVSAPEPEPQSGEVLPQAPAPDPAATPRVFGKTEGSGLTNAPGIAVNQLPTIAPEPIAVPAGVVVDAPIADAEKAIRKYAVPVGIPTDMPRVGVVLIDVGENQGGLDRGTIKALDLPLTIAIDPARPDAAEAAADYRAAGIEVAILASGLPPGASLQDTEVALQAWRAALPEAVAVVDGEPPVFQNDRNLSQYLVKALAREGLGLITQAQGTNAAEQIAKADGLPAARIWRVVDAQREDGAEINRTLGRAAFEAARQRGVAVMLHAWPESIMGLSDWVNGAPKAATVPVSDLALSQGG